MTRALAFAVLCLSLLAPPAWGHDKKSHTAQEAAIPLAAGGPFDLIDHTGKPVTDKDYRGRYMLVFFGYATCPGICPTGLRVMAETLRILGAEGDVLAPILVTIDPERDTPETLGPAMAKVHPRMTGLTGSFEKLNAAAKAYKVTAELVGWTLDRAPIVNHSSYIYLMGTDGKFLTLFPPIMDAEAMAKAIRGYIG